MAPPDRELADLLAYFRRRSRHFCTSSMAFAQAESGARTPEARALMQIDLHYCEGKGEGFIEAADSLERLLTKREKKRASLNVCSGKP